MALRSSAFLSFFIVVCVLGCPSRAREFPGESTHRAQATLQCLLHSELALGSMPSSRKVNGLPFFFAGSTKGEPAYEISTLYKAAKDNAGNFLAIAVVGGMLELELYVGGSGTPGSARDGPRLSTRTNTNSNGSTNVRKKSSTSAAIPPQELPAILSQPNSLCVDPCGDLSSQLLGGGDLRMFLFSQHGGNFSIRRVDAGTGACGEERTRTHAPNSNMLPLLSYVTWFIMD
eukprot:1158260-Pelagomonas_calceolata.AAC.1